MVCYPHLNVKIVATHGGINVDEDGVTHQAVEDIAIMRAIPGMKVVAVADPGEVLSALREVVRAPGPVFLRLARAEAEVIHTDRENVEFTIGKAEVLREGCDVTLMGVGMMVWEALKAAEMLEKEGIQARVINIRTAKPIDRDVIVKAA
jgi:transketolase